LRRHEVAHTPDGRCPVVDLLVDEFGEVLGLTLLWEFTCFPMSDANALPQARDLVQANRQGILPAFLRALQREVEEAMREGAERLAA
jgi:hypothetical protein